MKKGLSIMLLMVCFMSMPVMAKDYEKAMRAAIEKMYSASSGDEYLEAANQFDRIGTAEKDKWLPSYYAAFCYTMMATNDKEPGQIDKYLDKANEYLKRAEDQKGDKVEILAMRGFTAMLRITVDPAVRGQEYSMKSVTYLQQAMQIDNKNPRVVLMLGQMQYGTAQFFGSEATEACEMFRTAILLFDAQDDQEMGIKPTWGRGQATSMLANCEG